MLTMLWIRVQYLEILFWTRNYFSKRQIILQVEDKSISIERKTLIS